MNADFQLKLQAYCDGELPEREVREVEAALTGDAEARALLAELRNTAGALRGFEADIKLSEAREFYWSKIQREIQRQETTLPARPAIPLWRRLLMPSGAFAALVIVGLLAFKQMDRGVRLTQVETFLANSGAMTYRDEAEQTTVVWLSYAGENEFADTDSGDTID